MNAARILYKLRTLRDRALARLHPLYVDTPLSYAKALERYAPKAAKIAKRVTPNEKLAEVHKRNSPWTDLVVIRGERLYLTTRRHLP